MRNIRRLILRISPRMGLQKTTALACGGPATIHAHLYTHIFIRNYIN
jgi:hypothetical protein